MARSQAEFTVEAEDPTRPFEVVLIGCVPLLAVLEISASVVFAVVVVLAAILGGCGLLMAGCLAATMSRHDGEFPDDFAFRHFNLGGGGGTRGLHVPY